MGRNGFKRFSALALITSLLLGSFGFEMEAQAESAPLLTSQSQNGEETFSIERLTKGYSKVSKSYTAKAYTGQKVDIIMEDVLADAGYLTTGADYTGKVADVSSGDVLHLTVNVPTTALYFVSFDYYSYDDSILPIELALMVDGDYPFYEARNLCFETTWLSQKEVSLDRYGNQIVSLPDKWMHWENKYLMDSAY
ncbi:MAG: hypothetical protein IJY10_09780, partial [Lachnospiraceae bacterium]|nr:hypothetical protein [Lachnospiraceae bacterium]